MNQTHYTQKWRWDDAVKFLSSKYRVYAPTLLWGTPDYQRIDASNATAILYNNPRPSTPLKNFFLPVRENVSVDERPPETIIMGVPNCDLQALEDAVPENGFLFGDEPCIFDFTVAGMMAGAFDNQPPTWASTIVQDYKRLRAYTERVQSTVGVFGR